MPFETSFVKICQVLESVTEKRNKPQKVAIVERFFRGYPREESYDILRLFLPTWDRERGPYNLREATFAKTLINIFAMAPSSDDAQRLKNFNKSFSYSMDFADLADLIVRKRVLSHNVVPYSIREINDKLDAIARSNIREQENIIYDLFKSVTRIEIKWLIRLLLKQLKLGVGMNHILSAYHPDGPKYFLSNNNLKELCEELRDLHGNLAQIEVSLFRPFRPMLSLRCDAKEFQKSISDERELIVEEKFDGERFQLHFNAGRFKYISRNSFDYTKDFSHHAQQIGGAINARNAILDGEMMIYYKKLKKFGSKAMNADIKRVKPDSSIQQCFCVFDIVLFNDVNLCDKSLQDRKDLLEIAINPIEGLIQISPWTTARGKQNILNALNKSMDEQREGIMLKCPESKYLLNERRGWWKMKLEYFEGVMSDLDVLIIGGYFGIGASKGEIVSFLVAAKDPKGNFLSFAKVSTGLNREELAKLNQVLKDNWLNVGDKDVQEKVFWGKEIPDKWIRPENSVCLQVRGSELTKVCRNSAGSDYKTDYTLRFPRILCLRLDKPYSDCLTTEDLQTLTGGSSTSIVQKLNKRHLELTDLVVPETTKRRKKDDFFQLEAVTQDSNLLQSLKFHVISGLGEWSKDKVEKAIRAHSGIALIDVSKDSYCMLVGDNHIRTQSYKGDVDIVRVEWLRGVLSKHKLTKYEPIDVVYMSETSRRTFMKTFDKFGDNFLKSATATSLKRIFDDKFLKNDENFVQFTMNEIDELHREVKFKDERVLRGCEAYFDKFKVINDHSSTLLSCLDFMAEIEFKMNGGKVCDYLTKDVDCIITVESRVEEVSHYLKSMGAKIPIFSSIAECLRKCGDKYE